MRKNYLMSMMVIGITLTMVTLGTFAYYTFNQNFSGNTIQTGTFTLYQQMRTASGGTLTPTSSNFQITGLVPSTSYTKSGYIFIGNDGSSPEPVKFEISFTGLGFPTGESNPSGCPSLCTGAGCINVQLVANPLDYTGPTTPDTVTGLTMDTTTYPRDTVLPTLTTLQGWISSTGAVYYQPSGKVLSPGKFVVIGVQAQLPSCITDTWFMTKSTGTFTTAVNAAQVSYTPWP